jgi:hypothetical protein
VAVVVWSNSTRAECAAAVQHDWQEMREFMKSSRVSYALQMWQMHMRALLFDMTRVCSAKLCEDVRCCCA